jgi:hypothetical protein
LYITEIIQEDGTENLDEVLESGKELEKKTRFAKVWRE